MGIELRRSDRGLRTRSANTIRIGPTLVGATAWLGFGVSAAEPAAERGPTVALYVGGPERLYAGLRQSATSEKQFDALRDDWRKFFRGIDFARPWGWSAEFEPAQGKEEIPPNRFRVALPAANPDTLLERVAETTGPLEPPAADGSRKTRRGVVQARDGHVFVGSDAAHLKGVVRAADLLQSPPQDADAQFVFRPTTLPPVLSGSMIEEIEKFERTWLRARGYGDFLGGLQVAEEAGPAAARPVETGVLSGSVRQLLRETAEWNLLLRFRADHWELESQCRPLPQTPFAQDLAGESAAPSRFAVWEQGNPPFCIRESCRGSRGPFLQDLANAIAERRAKLPAAPPDDEEDEDVFPRRENLLPVLEWGEKFLGGGARDWGAVLRLEDETAQLTWGLADPDVARLRPHFRKLLTGRFRRTDPDGSRFEIREGAWQEGEFVVDRVVPLPQDTPEGRRFRRMFGESAEFAYAFGPDRILGIVGEDCRLRIRRAIRETAEARPTTTAFRAIANVTPGLRAIEATQAALDWDHPAAHQARLDALSRELETGPAQAEYAVRIEGGVRSGTLRIGANFVRIVGIFVEILRNPTPPAAPSDDDD